MHRRAFLISAAATVVASASITKAQENPAMLDGRYAEVNGLKLYYKVHGTGRPLVLLHGGGPFVDVFDQSIPLLAEGRQVISVHLQGHGRTRDIDRPFRYEMMADDIAGLVEELRLPKVAVLGYSLGGGVALQTAIRHSHLVDRLVLVSTTMKYDGSYPEVLEAFDNMEANAPMIARSVRQAPQAAMHPEVDWEMVFRKLGDMNKRPFDWSAAVKELQTQTMLVFADADSVRPEHMVEFWKAVGGGGRDAGVDGSQRPNAQLAVIPNTTHYSILGTPAVAESVIPFLDST